MTTAIVGRTGSGKTYSAKGIVEGDLAAGDRVCIIDPTGAWWGLRAPDENGRAIFADVVIIGGDHGDVPLEPSNGERLADLIASGAIRQCVIDISNMSGGEQIRFLTDLFERLFVKNRGPLTLVMDEADVMAPQNPLPDQRRLQGAVNKIVRRGRIKGFRPLMITQRPAVLDKSVLSQIDTLIVMRLTSPQDRGAIEAWVKGSADADEAKPVLASLASLKQGEGWFWAPADGRLERLTFPRIRSYDSSRTPEQGEAEVNVVAPAAGLAEIRKALAPVVETKPLAAKGKSAHVDNSRLTATAEEIAAAEKLGYDRGYAVGRADGLFSSRQVLGEVEKLVTGQLHWISENGDVRSASSLGSPEVSAPATAPTMAPPARRAPSKPPAAESAGGTLNSAARKMLAVLDTDPPVRRSWTQIATLSGLKARGGHFNAGKKALIGGGLAIEEAGLIRIATPSAGAQPDSVDAGALVETWAGALSGAAPKILRLMHDDPSLTSRAEIASRLGMKPAGGHWNGSWKELRDNEIVTISGDAVALSHLFRSAP